MEKLAKTYRIIDINDITKLPDRPGPPFMVVTFDDGYSDFIENAAPILLDLGIPACLNICPFLVDRGTPPWTQVLSVYLNSTETDLGAVPSLQLPDGSNFVISKPVNQKMFTELCKNLYLMDDEKRRAWLDNLTENLNLNFDLYSMMTWDDIRSCIQNGFSIGSHSYSHRNLSQVKEPELLETEISFSRQKILQETGITPSVFTFPNGQYNDSLLKIVEESGYSIALLHGINLVDLIDNEKPANLNIINDSDGLLCLPRIEAEKNWRETLLKSSGFHYQMKRITNFRRRRDLGGQVSHG
jgi:peptidoglycan/xylan/chitin deacetylase (PgdA/CDA1 family)